LKKEDWFSVPQSSLFTLQTIYQLSIGNLPMLEGYIIVGQLDRAGWLCVAEFVAARAAGTTGAAFTAAAAPAPAE